MAKLTRLGELERAVMDHLWSSGDPQTVRQVHEALSARRDLAYTTIMTVLQRLAKKNLVVQHRDDLAPTSGSSTLAMCPTLPAVRGILENEDAIGTKARISGRG